MREWIRSSLVSLPVCAAMMVMGCGDEENTADDGPVASAAKEPPLVFATRVAKLLETTRKKQDCAQLNAINERSYTRFPCPPSPQLSKSMASFKAIKADEYGAGAVVDYKSGETENGAAIVLFMALDRGWSIARFGVDTKPSIGTSDADSRAGFDRAVVAYLKAVRKRDCDAFDKVTFTGGTVDNAVCKSLFTKTRDLAKRIRLNPSARPRYEGGNRSYGFYGLETARPRRRNVTISVVRGEVDAKPKYLVLDVAPSPTRDEQHKALRALDQRKPMTSPARKADS